LIDSTQQTYAGDSGGIAAGLLKELNIICGEQPSYFSQLLHDATVAIFS
jgi:hypothetical protein